MIFRLLRPAELTRFATLPGPRATLGVVSGRRRQGKTFLLDAVTRASGGFMYTVTETTEADALRQFGEALARYRGQPTPFRFAHWDEAVTELMRIADAGGPTVAVIDEFPFLAKASPSLPSIIQRTLDPAAQHTNTPVRLLLCGSALFFMGKLLSGNAPLRGRAWPRTRRPHPGLPPRGRVLADRRPAHRAADQCHRRWYTCIPP